MFQLPAVNNRDKNFTRAKMERRLAQIEESVARYLSQLDTADLQDPTEALAAKTAHLKEKLAKLATEMQRLKAIDKEMLASPDQQISLTGGGLEGVLHEVTVGRRRSRIHARQHRPCYHFVDGAQRCLPSPEIRHTVKRAEQWIQLVGAEQNGDPEFSLGGLRQHDHVECRFSAIALLVRPDLSRAPGEGPIKSQLRLYCGINSMPTL
jgi:hypothetical protein